MFRITPRTICFSFKRYYSTPAADECLTTITDNDGVREITLNQPKTRNALSYAMMNSIIEGICEKAEDKSLRCIVLSSSGPVFSAGHNFKEMTADRGSEEHRKIFMKCAEMIKKIHIAPVPVIAKLDGLAAAAGCQLVASCDIVVCTEKSSFSTPGANFGLFCHTPGVAIGRVMPRMKAGYMLITGIPISAQEAYISGLASVVVPSDKLNEEVAKICDSIKTKSRPVIQLGKEFFYRQLKMSIVDAYNEGSTVMLKNLDLNDGKEGVKSFVEKRKPKWTNS